jgi:hypothetical protein
VADPGGWSLLMWCRTIESACFISLCGRVCLYLVEAGAEDGLTWQCR